MPEGDSELPDDGLPEDVPDDDDCSPQDIFRSKTEDLGGDVHER